MNEVKLILSKKYQISFLCTAAGTWLCRRAPKLNSSAVQRMSGVVVLVGRRGGLQCVSEYAAASCEMAHAGNEKLPRREIYLRRSANKEAHPLMKSGRMVMSVARKNLYGEKFNCVLLQRICIFVVIISENDSVICASMKEDISP